MIHCLALALFMCIKTPSNCRIVTWSLDCERLNISPKLCGLNLKLNWIFRFSSEHSRG